MVHFHFRYYKSLPPIAKAYGTACLLVTTAYQLGLCNPLHIALIHELVFTRFQVCFQNKLMPLIPSCFILNSLCFPFWKDFNLK